LTNFQTGQRLKAAADLSTLTRQQILHLQLVAAGTGNVKGCPPRKGTKIVTGTWIRIRISSAASTEIAYEKGRGSWNGMQQIERQRKRSGGGGKESGR
jgi:hypothetical protein